MGTTMETTAKTVSDYRDGCIAQLADDLAMMTERAVNAEADRDSYRVLAQQTLHALHDVTAERDQLRLRARQLLEAIRALRNQERIAA